MIGLTERREEREEKRKGLLKPNIPFFRNPFSCLLSKPPRLHYHLFSYRHAVRQKETAWEGWPLERRVSEGRMVKVVGKSQLGKAFTSETRRGLLKINRWSPGLPFPVWVLHLFCVLTVFILCRPSPLLAAQELRGRIEGQVSDASGSALPGVTVAVAGSALIQPCSTVTGPAGSYSCPGLPPGMYEVSFALQGFRSRRQENVILNLNSTITVNVRMELASIENSVTVYADSPLLDRKTTAVNTSFGFRQLNDLPNARDIWSVLAQAPGMHLRGYDVGGSKSGNQTAYAAYGVESTSRTLLEGIISNNTRTSNGGYFDLGSMEEFQVGASGNMGEAAGPGALLQFTVKSGGDEFHGDAYFDFQNRRLVADNVPDVLKASGGRTREGFVAPAGGITRPNAVSGKYDFDAGIGGPLIRRRLWFYGSFRNFQVNRTVIGLPEPTESNLRNETAKWTLALDPRNQLIFFYTRRQKVEPTRDVGLTRPPETAQYQDGVQQACKVQWTSTLSHRLFLDVQGALWMQPTLRGPTQTRSSSVSGVPPGRLELTTGQYSNAFHAYQINTNRRPQLTGSMSYFRDGWLGSHSIKAGFQAFRDSLETERFQPGDLFYYDSGGVPVEVEIYNTPNTVTNRDKALALYTQDTWSLMPRLSLNLGLRFDHYALGWPEQSSVPAQAQFFSPMKTGDATLVRWNSFGPRLGFAWDLLGSGRAVLKGFAGRFFIDPGTTVTAGANPVGFSTRRYVFHDRNGNRLLDPGELGTLLSTTGGGGSMRLDPRIGHPYGDELSGHLEVPLLQGILLRASLVYKTLRRMDAEVDRLRASAYNLPFPYQDAGADNRMGTADDRLLNLFDRSGSIGSDRVWTNPGAASGTPAFQADFRTVEFALQRRLSRRWILLSSWAQTRGADFLSESTSTNTDDAVSHVEAFLWQPNRRLFGRGRTTVSHCKLNARYEFERQRLALAASYRWQSGFPFARNISVRLPNAGTEIVPAEPFNANRSPAVGLFDLRLEKAFALGNDRHRLTALVDVFNLFNTSTVTNFRTRSGSLYKEIIALLDPRSLRAGFRYSF